MNRQEKKLNPLIEQTVDKEHNSKHANKRQEERDEEDIYDKCDISHYTERSKMRKDSIFLTKKRIKNEFKQKMLVTGVEEKISHEQICGKGKSARSKNDNKEKDDPSLMLDARLVRAEQRSSRSDSKKQCDVIAFEDELQSTIKNLFENG